MKTIRCLTVFSASLFALASGVPAAAPVDSDSSAASGGKIELSAAAKDRPETVLKRGMPADDVKKLMGKPESVRPMEAPTGTAEIWTYTRRIPGTTETILMGSAPVTTTVVEANGTTSTRTVGTEPVYRTIHHVTIETVELLMFNQHFLEKKVTRVDKQEFQ